MSSQSSDIEENGSPDEIPTDLVNPADVEDDQSDLLFKWREAAMGGEALDGIKVADGWMPSSDRYHGKSDISLNQARPIALLAEIDEIFPNIVGDGTYKSIADHVVDDYLELLTSWEGTSREQQVEVLKNMSKKSDANVNIGSSDGDDD